MNEIQILKYTVLDIKFMDLPDKLLQCSGEDYIILTNYGNLKISKIKKLEFNGHFLIDGQYMQADKFSILTEKRYNQLLQASPNNVKIVYDFHKTYKIGNYDYNKIIYNGNCYYHDELYLLRGKSES